MELEIGDVCYAPTNGLFIVIKQMNTHLVEIKLLDKKYKHYSSAYSSVTTLSHAGVPITQVKQCKIVDIHDLIQQILTR